MTTVEHQGGRAGSRILALGHYQPANIVTNDELAARVETTDEWIRDRVGIVTRRIAGSDETVVDMAATAAAKALASSGLSADEIDLVVVATCTMPSQVPGAAPQVASRLGITAPAAYDINTGCSGFCYGLATADSLIRTKTVNHAIVIGADKLSDWTDWTDRSTCVIFADGAGAAVLGPAESAQIGPVVWGSDGDNASLISVADRHSYIVQQGQQVFRWATSELAPLARLACERAGLTPEQLAAFVPHQANLRITESLARRVGVPTHALARDIVTAGNTSSASIPMALSRMIERGEVSTGQPVLLFGFGAGLTYAGQVITCP